MDNLFDIQAWILTNGALENWQKIGEKNLNEADSTPNLIQVTPKYTQINPIFTFWG